MVRCMDLEIAGALAKEKRENGSGGDMPSASPQKPPSLPAAPP